ncbi:MAG: hypothetical protein ACLR8P_18740 [Clostridium fessum]
MHRSKDASSWTEIQVNGAASLTEILDNQPEGTNEISCMSVRKRALPALQAKQPR